MKKIYIDKDFRCHTFSGNNYTPIETDFFDGKCDTFIEAYRFVPEGQSWTRKDGVIFAGEMIAPAGDVTVPLAVQEEYEKLQAQYQRGVNSI